MIAGYLILSIFFEATITRTLWLQRHNDIIAAVTSISIALRCILLVTESTRKEDMLRGKWRNTSPEATSGPVGKAFFGWLNRLFLIGYSRSLSLDDLYPLDKHLTSEYLYHMLSIAWSPESRKRSKSLFRVTISQIKWHVLSAFPPRLALTGFTFCQPFLITRAIDLSQEPATQASLNDGYGLIGAYFIVYLGIAVSSGQYQHLTYRAITMARGGLISMMFAKTSLLESNAVDSAQALTLMSADIERITNGWQTMHEIWAGIIEIAIAIYLLERQLGAACAIPIAVAIRKYPSNPSHAKVVTKLSIVSLLGSIFVMNLVAQRQALWLEAIERRIRATSTMLGSMKRVKMCGLTDTLAKSLHDLRKQELYISKDFRRLLIGSMFFAFATPVIAPVFTFTVFALLALRNGGTTLDVSKAFTSLSLFALLADPLSSLIMALTAFAGSIGCFARIQAFLDTENHRDERITLSGTREVDSSQTLTANETPSDTSIAWSDKLATLYSSEKSSANLGGNAFLLENASFGLKQEKDALLQSLQIAIPYGKLTMIVGPVGSGKTVLLKALLGEVPMLSGTAKAFSGNISYCDQTPFHMNGTIRESVVAFSEYDRRWYSSVIESCALQEDLQQLLSGDQTRIGSKGIALSGGQCQRLALARAAYARNDVCIFDDVFSGLDLDTENSVFTNLLGLDGLLRRQSSTVILASSSTKRIPYADHIIVLGEGGKIVEQGSFKELTASGGFVSALDLEPASWSTKIKDHKLDNMLFNATKITHIPPPSDAPSQTKETDETQLDANRRTGDLSVYYYYIKNVGRLAVTVFVVTISGYVFCYSFPQIWLGWWADSNATARNQHLGYYLGIYALLAVAALACLVMSCWSLIITMVPQSGESFHWKLLKTVSAAPMSFFSTTDTGITLNRFSQDLQLIDMDLPVAALNFFTAFVLCLAQVILIGVSSVYAAISFPIWFVALYFIQKVYLRTSRQLRFLDLEAKSPLYTQFSETIAGLITVRAFGWSAKNEAKNRVLLDQSQQPFYLLYSVQRWLQLVLDLVVTAIAVLLIILVVELRGRISGAFVGVALLNIILFSQNLKLVLQFWTMLETHIGAIARIKNFAITTPTESLSREEAPEPPNLWPAHGSINFHEVYASYDASRVVLKDMTFSIQAGEKIAICGRTGSGKSSIIMAIFGLIDVVSGHISIDHVDLSSISREEARSRIIGLPQEGFLLIGSVRLNVDPYNNASDEEITDALEEVQLWEKVKENGGLDKDIQEVNLSHGQKQLLYFAQALLRKSSILILDEATSR